MSKRKGDPVGDAIRELVHVEAAQRKDALVRLTRLATDLEDVRNAQSLIAWILLYDPSDDVRIEAAEHICYRASEGNDVGFALPACRILASASHTPETIRNRVRDILASAETRTPTAALFRRRG